MKDELKKQFDDIMIVVAKEKKWDITDKFYNLMICTYQKKLINLIVEYLKEYDDEFCLFDKLNGKTEYQIIAPVLKTFLSLYIDTVDAIAASNVRQPNEIVDYVKYASAIDMSAHEHISIEFHDYMESKFASLREKSDYSREEKEQIKKIEKEQKEFSFEEINKEEQRLEDNREMIFEALGVKYVIQLSSAEWMKKNNGEDISDILKSYFFENKAKEYLFDESANKLLKIRYDKDQRWQEYLNEKSYDN